MFKFNIKIKKLMLTTHHSRIFMPTLEHRRPGRLSQPLHKKFNNTGFYQVSQHSSFYRKNTVIYRLQTMFSPCTRVCRTNKIPYYWLFYIMHIFTSGFTLTKKFCIGIREWIYHFLDFVHIFDWYIIDWFH